MPRRSPPSSAGAGNYAIWAAAIRPKSWGPRPTTSNLAVYNEVVDPPLTVGRTGLSVLPFQTASHAAYPRHRLGSPRSSWPADFGRPNGHDGNRRLVGVTRHGRAGWPERQTNRQPSGHSRSRKNLR